MNRLRSVWSLVSLLVLGAILAIPGGALADRPDFHDRFSGTFADNICGVSGTSALQVNNVVSFGPTSFKTTGEFTDRFTADDGRAATIHSAGASTGSMTDNGDGTITFTNTWQGLPEQIRGGGGGVATRDAGLLTLAVTVDATTFEVISEQVIEHGPHPEADADFSLFCDAFLTALG